MRVKVEVWRRKVAKHLMAFGENVYFNVSERRVLSGMSPVCGKQFS